jgi:integrase
MKIDKYKDRHTNRFKWTADFTCDGERHRPVADSSKELYDEIDAIKRRSRQRKLGLEVEREAIMLAALRKERVKEFDIKRKNHRRATTILEDFEARFPNYLVEDLTTLDLNNYVRALKVEYAEKDRARPEVKAGLRPTRSISPETINKSLGHVSGMLKAAPTIFKDLVDYRPPKFPWEKVSKRKRKRPITEREDELLLAALRAPRQVRPREGKKQAWGENPQTVKSRHEIADIFEINLNTGMRGGECVKMTWPQVDWEGAQIYLGETKNGESRFVPMNSRVLEILTRRYEARAGLYVFPNPKGTAPRYDYTRTFRRVAESLGLPYGLRTPNGFTMHVTRHTATTRMLQRGHDMATVQEIVGHSDKTMTLIYSHATQRTKNRAIESLVRKKPVKKPTSPAEVEP